MKQKILAGALLALGIALAPISAAGVQFSEGAGATGDITLAVSAFLATIQNGSGGRSMASAFQTFPADFGDFPAVSRVPELPAVETVLLSTRVTAYSSTPDQTDGNPFITASGEEVRDGVIAANFLPFGTQVRIPSLFGDKIFTVKDRMNRRYRHSVDIWMPKRAQALYFGVHYVPVEIVSQPKGDSQDLAFSLQ